MLIDLLPFFYKDSEIVNGIQGSLDNEDLLILNVVKEVINDLFISSSTNIELWEKMLNIVPTSTNLEFRRSNILAKIRGKATTTKAMIKNVSESYSNGEVDVIENNATYSITIRFVGNKGIPPNLDDLKKAIEEIKPAHLGVTYEFIYNTWNDVSPRTWTTIKIGTWNDLKER